MKYIKFFVALGIAAMLMAGVYIQSSVLLNHDVGWVTNSAARLLDGAEFGKDIFAANPPLIWWLSVPSAALARATPLSEVGAIRLFVVFLCLWGTSASWYLLARAGQRVSRSQTVAVVLAAAFALFILPGAIFAQREHIAFALTLPYAVLTALRNDGLGELRNRETIIIGLLAGVGFALKPYFLFVLLLLELVTVATRRSVGSLCRPETLAISGVILTYLACVAIFSPDYFTVVIPLVRSIYWAFESSNHPILYAIVAPAIWTTLSALFLVLLSRSAGPLHVALAAVSIGFLASYWLQSKGYEYHAYPVHAASLMLLTLAAVSTIESSAPKLRRFWMSIRVAVPLLVIAIWTSFITPRLEELAYWHSRANIHSGDIGSERLRLISAVTRLVESPDDCVYAFSTHPYPAFPTMNYVDAKWGARSNSQFAIPAIIRSRLNPDVAARHNIVSAESFTRQAVLDDFLRCPPKVVIILENARRHALGLLPYDEVAFFSEDYRFAELWRHYEAVDLVGNARIYVRRGPGDVFK